jgi:hypothetical protein
MGRSGKRIKDALNVSEFLKNLRTSNRDRYYHKHDTDTFKANIDKTKAVRDHALNEISQVKTACEALEDIIGEEI